MPLPARVDIRPSSHSRISSSPGPTWRRNRALSSPPNSGNRPGSARRAARRRRRPGRSPRTSAHPAASADRGSDRRRTTRRRSATSGRAPTARVRPRGPRRRTGTAVGAATRSVGSIAGIYARQVTVGRFCVRAANAGLTRPDARVLSRAFVAIPQAFSFGFVRSVTLRVRVPTADGCPTSLRRSKCITSSLADLRAIGHSRRIATTPEEATPWASVCVIVIGDRPHVVVDVVIEAVVLDDDDRKTFPEPVTSRCRRGVRRAVARQPSAPHTVRTPRSNTRHLRNTKPSAGPPHTVRTSQSELYVSAPIHQWIYDEGSPVRGLPSSRRVTGRTGTSRPAFSVASIAPATSAT